MDEKSHIYSFQNWKALILDTHFVHLKISNSEPYLIKIWKLRKEEESSILFDTPFCMFYNYINVYTSQIIMSQVSISPYLLSELAKN